MPARVSLVFGGAEYEEAWQRLHTDRVSPRLVVVVTPKRHSVDV